MIDAAALYRAVMAAPDEATVLTLLDAEVEAKGMSYGNTMRALERLEREYPELNIRRSFDPAKYSGYDPMDYTADLEG